MTTRTLSSGVRSITSGLFLLQLFLAVCLPGGTVLGLKLKVISSGLFLAVFVLYVVTCRPFVSHAEIIFAAVVAAFLCFWSFVGLLNGQADTGQILSQLKSIATAISIAWLSIFAIRRGLVTAERLVTVVIYGLFSLSAVKLALVAASFFSYIDPIQITQLVFGETSATAYPILFGFVRLMFPVDILGPFALFALLAPSVSGVRFGRTSKLFICTVVVLGSGFLAYSRFIWLIYFVSFIVALIVEQSWKTMAVSALAAFVLFVSFYEIFNLVYQDRFVSEGELSDSARIEQIRALREEIDARPILGKGMGAHANGCIRNDTDTYSYELQWLALLMQFGIVGEIGILLLIAASARDLVMTKGPAKLWMLLLFVLWLLASWTNPYLTSSFAGATFGFFMAMFYRMRYTNLNGEARVRVAGGPYITAVARKPRMYPIP